MCIVGDSLTEGDIYKFGETVELSDMYSWGQFSNAGQYDPMLVNATLWGNSGLHLIGSSSTSKVCFFSFFLTTPV